MKECEDVFCSEMEFADDPQNGQERRLEDAVHELAQPLTALSFVLDLALLRPDPDAWREALLAARTECRRAVVALEAVRSAGCPDRSLLLHSREHFGDLL